ncbi:MAG: alginate O-acetyltransferase AlgX-related protein [Candidatus Krumholzibacteriia bacterium]
MRRIVGLPLLLLGGLLAGEGAVRYFEAAVPAPSDSPYVPDAAAGYRLRPSGPGVDQAADDHVNALGFRDREHPPVKPAGTRRVLGVGDSFVYGAVPPRENFLEVAARELAAAPDAAGPVEMVLLGCPGWNTEHEVGIVRELGPTLAPDLIVLCFSVDTDVTGIPVRGRIIQGNLLYVGAQTPGLDALRRSRLFVLGEQVYLRRVTAAARRVARALTGRRAPAGAPAAAPAGAAGDTAFAPPTRHYLGRQLRLLPLFAPEPDPRTAALWREAERQLDRFADACRAAGSPWVLLVVPAEIQADPRLRDAVLASAGRPADAYDFDLPERRLAAWARARGVPFVDPLAALRAARAQGRLYAPDNSHWNARGNALAGRLLAAALAPPPRTGSR